MSKKFTAQQQLVASTALAKAKEEGATPLQVEGKLTVALNQVREQIYQHRIHEIYEATILQEMVLHGTGGAFEYGPALVPGAELEATAPLWSGAPILVNHPEGGWDLGNEVYVKDASGLGFLAWPWYSSRENKLTAELWIDKEVAEKNDRWVDIKLQAENGTLELSTGYLLLANEEKAGTFKGAAYNSIHKGIIPLHLALLPDATGACSNAAGCGINQEAPEEESKIAKVLNIISNKLDNVLNNKPDAAVAAKNVKKEGEEMTPEQIKLMAALQEAFSLDKEAATKLATNCDCPDLAVKVTAGLEALVADQAELTTLKADHETVKAELKVFTDAQAEAEEAKRAAYLTALNMKQDDPGVSEIPTTALKAMAESKKAADPDPEVKIKTPADKAMLHATPEGKVAANLAPASTMPKAKE